MSKTFGSMVLGGKGRNVEPLGLFVAWLICNGLASTLLERVAGSALARVKLHDLSGGDFLATVLNGELKSDHLSEAGCEFAEHFLMSGKFRALYDAHPFAGENEWLRYEMLSPAITAAYRHWREPPKASAKILQFPGRRG